MSHPPKFYDLEELAKSTGRSKVFFRRLCQAGDLEAIKAGSGPTSPWLVREDWWDAWAEKNKYRASK